MRENVVVNLPQYLLIGLLSATTEWLFINGDDLWHQREPIVRRLRDEVGR